MIDFLEQLGLLEKTNIGLPGEVSGLFRRNEYAKELQLATLGFGQSLTCTPLALTSAFSILGNRGIRMQPRLVKRVGDREFPIREAGRVISEEAADQVALAMESVIESDAGTGKTLRIPGYRLGGKTGTAEKVGTERKGYVSNFIGYVPAQEPKAVILVMVNNPKAGGYYGSTVAGPVFVEVAKSVIRRFNIPPSEPKLGE
jgi:cell division protein FtsI/penicillin-binding protein 2